MADPVIEMIDIQTVLSSNPVFAQEVKLEAAQRRINELEEAVTSTCACKRDEKETSLLLLGGPDDR